MNNDTLMDILGISFKKDSDCNLGYCAYMKITHSHCNPMGTLNGGVSALLAETFSGFISNTLCADNKIALGQSILVNHLNPAFLNDELICKVMFFNIKRSSHTFVLNIYNQNKQDIATANMVNVIVDNKFNFDKEQFNLKYIK